MSNKKETCTVDKPDNMDSSKFISINPEGALQTPLTTSPTLKEKDRYSDERSTNI